KIKYSNQDIRYFLGLKFLSLGQVASEHLDLRIIALPHMKALRNDINEVVHLTVLDGNQAVYIEKVESTRNLRLYTAIGKSSSLHIGSGPKLLFAYLPSKLKNRMLTNYDFTRSKNKDIPNKASLDKELKQIKKIGYSISKEEQDRGTMGISYPILDASHENVAALTVSGPLERFGSEKKFFLKTNNTAKNIPGDFGQSFSDNDNEKKEKQNMLNKTLKNHINGEWVEANEVTDVINPATGETVVQVPLSTKEAVDQVVEAAKKAQKEWALEPAPMRAEILFEVGRIMK